MESKISRFGWRILTALVVAAGLLVTAAAQDIDPDPNSPTPVLITENGSSRALATIKEGKGISGLSKVSGEAFEIGSRVIVYAGNLEFMDGEGANSLRIYAEDKAGRQYRFPVQAARKVSDDGNVYAIRVLLTDELGFWPQPAADGDLSIYLTWRGLASNRALLGLGKTGGDLKPSAVGRPAPLDTVLNKNKLKEYLSATAPEYVGYRYSGDRIRFLEQATFGPTTALDNRIRRIGLRTWLAEQFDPTIPYGTTSLTNPYPNQPLKPTNAPSDCDGDQVTVPDVPPTCFRDTYSMYQPQTWFMREAFYGDAQLKHRASWALAQIWVTSGNDIQQGRQMVEYHKIISNNIFGNFRQLMADMTLNPTMGQYLDMAISTRTNPNENYAREIMQLFTIGLFKLNPDGTPQCVEHNPCQAGDTKVSTYDQNNVNDLTKVLTGWSFCNVTASCPNLTAGTVDYIDPMLLNGGVTTVANNRHDLTAKTLLSYTGSTTTNVAACGNCTTLPNIATYANNSINQALDNIFNHPNVGPFISRIMIQHMVTSDPTPAYVGRVASVFNNNGNGVRGDMKAVIKAILLDPEARGDVKTDPNYGKLREPVQLATNYARIFGVRSADGASLSDGNLTRGRSEFNNMSQVHFMSPTVFNFFPPDYSVPGTALNGPEFAIMNTGTAIARANFFNRMVFSVVSPPSAASAPFPVSNPDSPNGTSFDFSEFQALATTDTTGNALVDELNRRMMHGTMTTQNKNTILTAVTNIPGNSGENFLQRARQAIYLIATSSQWQVQR